MFGFNLAAGSDAQAVLGALGRSLAIIEFAPNGTILSANPNFCNALGYDLGEIIGKHHSLFVDPEEVRSPAYRAFWERLGRGEFDAAEYKRIGKGGKEVWIQASYNPVVDSKGRIQKVVKVATVITEQKLRNVEYEAKLNAISLTQAVIEFTPAGEIINANENFLKLLGYQLREITGKHHSLFVEAKDAQSSNYQAFWRKLNSGEFVSATFKRIGKGGKEVWIQASYNPIFDLNKKVTKVVKYASDITDLTEIGFGLARLADNNLDQPINKAFQPGFDKLRVDFNHAHDNLRAALVQVAGVAGAIQSGTREISAASDDLSRRTEQQAASLEETAAALDEITATVRKTAEGSKHAREVVSQAKEAAEQSGAVVRQAVEAMGGIEKSANQIGNIIGVIDEIAFQTNLLALNAGVEAARAGEAGRGFAVVASEVRALAQRSADAAKEIKTLISASSAQVKQGVDLVGQTGRALDKIVVQVGEINGIVVNIAASAQEQATALHEVNTAVNQMDQVTQQNAAMVEESTAASHTLSGETDELFRLIAGFKIGADGAQSSVHSARKAVEKRNPTSARQVTALKTVGLGGAVRKPEPHADWQEF